MKSATVSPVRRGLWCWPILGLLACAPKDVPLPPLAAEARSVLLASIGRRGSPPRLFGAEPPFALLSQDLPHERRVVVSLSRPLADLDLERGPLPPGLPRGEGRPVPGILDLLVAEEDEAFAKDDGPVPFDLPPFDWSDLARRGRCADGDTYVTSTCGSTLSLPLVVPSPPRLTGDDGQCPPGWSAEQTTIDRGPTLGPMALPLCRPPPRRACGPAELQAAGDAACQALGAPCDPRDPYSPALPRTATISFVLASAPAGGDGTRARPFASLTEAALGARTRAAQVLAIGQGSYPGALRLSGDLDVQGACAAATILSEGLALHQHRGTIADLGIQGPLSIDSSTTALRAVWAAGAGEIRGGSQVQAERSILEAPAQPWTLASSTVSLSHGELRGAVAVQGGALRLSEVATRAAEGQRLVSSGASLEIQASLLGAPILAEGGGVISADRCWFAGAPAPPGELLRSVKVAYSRARLRRCTFDHGRQLVSCPAVPCEASQAAVDVQDGLAELEDLYVIAPPRPAVPPQVELSAIELGAGGPHRLARILSTEGSAEGSLKFIDGDLIAEDIGIYGGKSGLRFAATSRSASVTLRHVVVSRCEEQGLILGGQYTGRAEDLGAYDCRVGISVEGRLGTVEVVRASVSSAGPAAIGLERTLQGTDPGAFSATLRSIDLRGPFGIALSVEVDASLDLEDLTVDGADTGAVLRAGTAPRRLRRATIQAARNGLSLESTVRDLRPLLDHVLIRAPRPIDRGDAQ